MDRGSWQAKSMRSQRVRHNWMAEHAHAHTTLPKDCWKGPNVITIKIVSYIWKHFPNVFHHSSTCHARHANIYLLMVWNGDTNSPGSFLLQRAFPDHLCPNSTPPTLNPLIQWLNINISLTGMVMERVCRTSLFISFLKVYCAVNANVKSLNHVQLFATPWTVAY